jgi:hypothetical protein
LIGFKIYSFTGTKESLFPSKSSIVEFPVSGSSGRHFSGSAKSGWAHSTTSRVERQTGGIVFVRLPIPGKYTLRISNNRNISYESTKDKLILQSLGEQQLKTTKTNIKSVCYIFSGEHLPFAHVMTKR